MTTRTALALVFIIIGFTLAGCGLSPVYGTYAESGQPSVKAALNDVYIETIPERSGQKLRNLLIDRFYQSGMPAPGAAAYHLRISGISESIYGLGIAKDATATRSQLRLSTSFSLIPAGEGARARPVYQRNVSAISSFNTLASQYTTLVTEEDARDQTIKDLAQQITTLLELYFTNPSAHAAQEQVSDPLSENERIQRDPRRRAIGEF